MAPGFEPVREQFEANLAASERGAAFAAVVDGELVVDLWGGRANSAAAPDWREDTLCMYFSGTKGLVATVMLRLIEAGALDLDAPVAEYWPGFEVDGKEGVLIRHVLSHQAGVPGIRGPVTPADIADFGAMAAAVARQHPFWEPGSRLWYHPLTYGWICGELVRRATGASLGTYLRQEIAEPFGLELWVGLPPELVGRVATNELADTWPGVASNAPAERISAEDVRAIWRNPEYFKEPLDWNRTSWRTAEIPGVNGIGSARAMALHYGILAMGGTLGGTRMLGGEAIALGQEVLAEGEDPCDGAFLRFGAGWALQTADMPFGPPARAFGHGGAGGSMHGAWPAERVGFSYLPNLMREDADDRRAVKLLEALHRCLPATSGSVTAASG